MGKRDAVTVTLNCDCGHSFEEAIGGADLEAFRFTCSSCGKEDQLTSEQIDAIVAAHKEAQETLNKRVRDFGKDF